MSLRAQFGIAASVAAVLSVSAVIILRIRRFRALVRVPEALKSIDLSGAKPWMVGCCAGFGEELLFRAALQPLVGLSFGAVIFAIAHVRTALLSSASNIKRAAYMVNVAVAGVALGLVFEHIGLVAAVLIHATIDVVGLLVYRILSMDNAPTLRR
jgi:membrane protease YdiL (CAAX protease family)